LANFVGKGVAVVLVSGDGFAEKKPEFPKVIERGLKIIRDEDYEAGGNDIEVRVRSKFRPQEIADRSAIVVVANNRRDGGTWGRHVRWGDWFCIVTKKTTPG
jgi:hypothetical protein